MPGRCCFLKRENELVGAMAMAAAALGIDFVSGRALAAFYAQTGLASWTGIGLSAVLYGLMIGLIVRLARRCGAQSVEELLRRLPGGGVGSGMYFLYICILVLAGGMLMNSAGDMSALMVPLHHGKLVGSSLTLLAAGVLAFSGGDRLKALGGGMVLLMLVFELALLLFAQLPASPRYEVELRLKENWLAALGFALLHMSACLCLSAGLAVRFSGGRIHPGKMGACAGGVYGLLLAVGNAVLMVRDERILGLKLPFTALSAGWGSTGFYLNAGLSWLFCAYALTGLIHGLLPAHRRANPIGK